MPAPPTEHDRTLILAVCLGCLCAPLLTGQLTGCGSSNRVVAPPPGQVPQRTSGIEQTTPPPAPAPSDNAGTATTGSTAGTRSTAPAAAMPTTRGGRLLSPPADRPAAPRQDAVPLVGTEGRRTINAPSAGNTAPLTPDEIGGAGTNLQQPSTAPGTSTGTTTGTP